MYSQYNIESISDVVTDKTTNLGKKNWDGGNKRLEKQLEEHFAAN